MPTKAAGNPTPPGTDPSLAIGAQWPDGHVLEGALVLEYIRDRVPDVPGDLVAVFDAIDARVILEGTPKDGTTRALIVDVARGVPGVASVEDRMSAAG